MELTVAIAFRDPDNKFNLLGYLTKDGGVTSNVTKAMMVSRDHGEELQKHIEEETMLIDELFL